MGTNVFGSARVQARNWRYMALAVILSAGFAVALGLAIRARDGCAPWVVQVDNLGEAQTVAPAAG